MAYRLIMGREPDSEASVAGHVRDHASIDELRRTFFGSDEFLTDVMPGMPAAGKPLDWPPIRVETEVTPEQLQEMIARVERNFRHMGETEPHWSVISEDRYKAAQIPGAEREFFESGRGVVREFLVTLARCGLDPREFHDVFELGCGVGRTTIWLAEKFDRVTGADVSTPHLALAEQAAAAYRRRNMTLLHIDSIAKLSQLPRFDVFFSIIVLQHNPPPLMEYILRIMLTQLAPGGVAYFQIPTHALGYRFDIAEYLARPVDLGVPEMHLLPQSVLIETIEAAHCRILELREDGAAGREFVSNRLLVQKPR